MQSHDHQQEYMIDARQYAMLINGHFNSITNELYTNPNFRFSYLVWQTNKNNPLHIAAGAGKEELVEFILHRDHQLLHCQNKEGDLPLHVAVRAGQQSVVKMLLQHPNSHGILQRENEEKNTVLHVALEYQHKDLAEFLFQQFRTNFYLLNKRGISPLYLAIKSEFWELAHLMLEEGVGYPHLVEDALRVAASSVVHAAIMARRKDMVDKMMDYYPDLRYSMDDNERRALSYAAQIGFVEGVTCFLQRFPEEAFQPDNDESFPIHNACNINVIEVFLMLSPETKWLENSKGQTIFHTAASTGKACVINYLLKKQEGLDKLINMKDKDGNTPLHLATIGNHAKVVYLFVRDVRVKLMLQNKQGFTPLDLVENSKDGPSLEKRLTWLALSYANAPRSPQSVNSLYQGMIPSNEKANEGKDHKERLNTLLMVSTLIATITFAAGFTIPGGYSSSEKHTDQQGMAILAHRLPFQVFVLSNTVALFSSTFAAVTLIWAHLDDPKLCLTSLDFALPSLTVALTMMSVAFTTGLFVVLHGVCDWLAFAVFIMGCAFLPMVLVVFVPLYFPSPYTRSKYVRHIFHGIFMFMLLVCDRKKFHLFST